MSVISINASSIADSKFQLSLIQLINQLFALSIINSISLILSESLSIDSNKSCQVTIICNATRLTSYGGIVNIFISSSACLNVLSDILT